MKAAQQLLPLVALLAIVGCHADAPLASTSQEPPEAESDINRVILDAALRQAPIEASPEIIIGIQDESRTETYARVSFENAKEWVVVAFHQLSGDWVARNVISRGETVKTPSGSHDVVFSTHRTQSAFRSSTQLSYNGLIANLGYIGGPVMDQWFVSGLKNPATYTRLGYYGGLNLNRADFFPGVQVVNDTSYIVTQIEWNAYRVSSPACDWYTGGTTLLIFPFTCWSGSSYEDLYPEYFQAMYRLTVEAPLEPLEFSLFDYESNDSHYRIFRLSPSYFDAPIESVAWESSPNGVSFWTTLAVSCYGQEYAGAFRSDPLPTNPVYLRATVTLTNGQSGTGTPFYGSPTLIDITDISCP